VEHAAGGRVDRRRRLAPEHDLLARAVLARIRDRRCGQQRDRVRVDRLDVELLRRRELHHLAEVHDRDPVRHVAHDRQVVGDEDVGEPELVLEVVEQVDDLSLDRDVERRDRLVEQHQARVHGQRARDADTLALAAGELVREAVNVLGVQAHAVEQLAGAPAEVIPFLAAQLERPADDLADALARVQRRLGVLEDHLHLPANRAQTLPAARGDVLALEAQRAPGRLQQPDEAARQRRLAATGLAHHAERLALVQRQRDVLDRMHLGHLAVDQQARAHREAHLEVLGLEQGPRL
jgi:hypothetical protein